MDKDKCPDCIERGGSDIRDIKVGGYCRRDYNRRQRAAQVGRPVPEVRKPGEAIRGPRPDPERSAKVPCAREACGKTITIRGTRLSAYRERGVLPYHAECRRLDASAWVEGLCACGCGQTWRKYRSEIASNKTGRIFADASHAFKGGLGLKPRTGREVPCEGCHLPMYVQPAEEGKKRFHRTECRRMFEAAQAIKKTCPTCGTLFEVPPSLADKVYDTMHCKRLAMMTRAIPGTEHNGLPKRWDDKGYVLVYEPSHPASGKYGWIYEHRLVAEREIVGRYLAPYEEVNHGNEIKDDNDPSNLEVLDKRTHASITGKSVQNRRRAAMAELEQLREEKRLREAGYRPVGEVTDEALRILTELVAADALTDEQRAQLAAFGERARARREALLAQEVKG